MQLELINLRLLFWQVICTVYDFVIIFQLSSINYFEPAALSEFFCLILNRFSCLQTLILNVLKIHIDSYGLTPESHKPRFLNNC
jgi:hypothetical protein